ncbi:MAG: hypothetical protein WD359_06195 [Dehalococcoidia bacterium]
MASHREQARDGAASMVDVLGRLGLGRRMSGVEREFPHDALSIANWAKK